VLGQAKGPYAGTTINASCFQTTYFEYLKNYFPEFEEKTGIKVNFNMQAFPVYNQRTDLELSTKGSSLDVINVTFIYSGRWIGAGWVTSLDEFTKNPNATPPDWDPADFVAGPQSAMQNAKGETFGFSWEAGAMILAASRADLVDKAGLALPKTFDELIRVCDAIHGKEDVAAFTADRLHHWNWIPYLMGTGGKVFKDPPDNLTPTLDTPEAARSAEWYANLLVKYGPDGILSYSDDQSMRSQMSGRANIRTQAITWMVPLAKHAESTVQKTVRYALMPAGPAGNFPGSNSHGLGIPRRLAQEGSGVGVHQVGAVEGDDRQDRRRARLSQRLPPLDHRQREVQGAADAQRPGRGIALPAGARARRQGRLHEVSHRAGLSAGRRQDQQGDRAHRHQAARTPPAR
jgi:multiple sugar transport system substrate-binding protein